MIKQIPILLVLVGIVVIIIGFNLVMTYGLSFYTGIALFFWNCYDCIWSKSKNENQKISF